MKKKPFHLLPLCLSLMLLVLLSASCSVLSISEKTSASSTAAAATLTVCQALPESRTALPDAAPEDFTSLVLTGRSPGGESVTLGSWTSYTYMQDSAVGLETGSWSFTLTASTGSLTYTGTTAATISGGENSISFTLSRSAITYTGSGAVSIMLTVPPTVTAVTAGLYDAESETLISGYADETLTVTAAGSSNTVTYSKTAVKAGIYLVLFKLYAGDDLYVGDWREYAGITQDCTSSSSPVADTVDSVYPITYVLDDGVLSGTAPGSYTRRSSDIALPESSRLSRTGAFFRYWYELDANGNEVVLEKIAAGSVGARTVYAKWRYTTLYVSETGSDANSGGSLANAKATLQGALAAFDAADYDCTVYVSGTVSGTTTIDSAVAAKTLSLTGLTGYNNFVANGYNYAGDSWSDVLDGGANGSVLTIASGCTVPVSLSYLRVQNGQASRGAGIYMQGASTLNLSYASVGGNLANVQGAAVYAGSGSIALSDTYVTGNTLQVSGNTSVYGAAISAVGSTISITGSSVINDNTVSFASYSENNRIYGGNIYLENAELSLGDSAFTGWCGTNNAWSIDGQAVYVTSSASVTMNDNASAYNVSVAAGALFTMNGSATASYISLASGAYITIGSSLSSYISPVTSITPATYEEGLRVLTGTSSLVASHYKQFAVSENNGSWAVASDGTLISTSLYVAGDGASADFGTPSDANSGIKSAPFATLQKAVDTIAAKGWTGTCAVYVSGTLTGATTVTSSVKAQTLSVHRYWGTEGGASTTLTSSSGSVLTLSGTGRVELDSLTLSGNSSSPVIALSGSTYLYLSYTTITNGKGGISAKGTSAAELWGPTITENTGTGLLLSEKASAWLWGGSISNNTVTGNGGGISIANGTSLYLRGDCSVTGNSATGKGNGIYSAGTFRMSYDGVVASNNDVYLASGCTVTIENELTGTAPVATITPETYTAGTTLLSEYDTENGFVASYCTFFNVTQNGEGEWYVTEDGLLAQDTDSTMYTITYNYNGGSLADGFPETTSFTGVRMVTLPLAVKDGYIFAGWHEKSDYSDDYLASIPAGTKKNVTLYAHWLEPKLYVSSSGDDSYTGLALSAPLRSVQRAFGWSGREGKINTIVSTYSALNTVGGVNRAAALDWTIAVSGTVSGSTQISTSDGSPIAASSITLTGATGLNGAGVPQDALDAESLGTVLDVSATVPVTVTNLSVQHGYSTLGSGIIVRAEATVTLSDGVLVTGNYLCAGTGAYVFANAVFALRGSVRFAADNNIYLNDGAYITVADTLTAASPVASITPMSYTAGTQLLIDGSTSGMVSANYAAFAVSNDIYGGAWSVNSSGCLQQTISSGISIDTPVYSSDDLNLSWNLSSDGASYIFSANAGYSSYVWVIDGNAENTAGTNSWSVSCASLAAGNHTLLLIATDAGGNVHSASTTLTVDEL